MTHPLTSRRTAMSPRARIRDERLPLIHRGPSRWGYPDGAWSPRSVNLVDELPPLLADLKQQGLPVARVLYNPALWSLAPGRMASGARWVGLEATSALSPHLIRLFLTDSFRCIDLLVHFPTRGAVPSTSHPGSPPHRRDLESAPSMRRDRTRRGPQKPSNRKEN
jgi:hypothetical protein